MAELYLARTVGIEGFEKLVVLKRILPQYLANQQFVSMFLNEARLAAMLQHPNIAQVYDIGVENGDYFFAMEYIHGEDLGRLNATGLDAGVPMSLDAALTVCAGLCAGLHYAHEKADDDGKPMNVVHRDVSPSNVLVSYDGAVKVVDFGIARASSHNTTQGGLKGKIVYMSPEQCRGNTKLDRRSDVFSVGAILFELTTGRTPFVDETEFGILNQIVNTDAPAPSSLVPNYPLALERIVRKALARDPDQRYATTLALQGELEDFAHDNRLRVSPLVLARLMSALFPARLEEWEHARKQGAFFVEQHVVQTLLEQRGTDEERSRSSGSGFDPSDPDMEATGIDTPIDVSAVDEATNLQITTPPPPDESRPIPMHVERPNQQVLPNEPLPPPPSRMTPNRMPTGGGMHRLPTPVPGMPGAVPIIRAFTPSPVPPDESAPIIAPPPPTASGHAPAPVPIAKSNRWAILAVSVGLLIAFAVVGYLVLREPIAPDAMPANPAKKAEPSAEKIDDVKVTKPATGAKLDDVTVEAPPQAEPSGEKFNDTVKDVNDVKDAKDAKDAKNAKDAKDAKNVKPAKAGKAGSAPPAATHVTKPEPGKSVEKKPATDKKGSAWRPDSPFMPVRH